MSLIELKVPDIGGHENVDIIAVEIKTGDTIAIDDTLITLETDKATMDVPAEAAGVGKEVKVKGGDKISEGGVIAVKTVRLPLPKRRKPPPRPPLPKKPPKPPRPPLPKKPPKPPHLHRRPRNLPVLPMPNTTW